MAYDLGVTAGQRYIRPVYSPGTGGVVTINRVGGDNYYYHAFYTVGTFTNTSTLPVPIELVDESNRVVNTVVVPPAGSYTVSETSATSFTVHTFTSSGALIASGSIDNVSVLTVAGGGGGGYGRTGNHVGGGGGAGGVRYYENLDISAGTKTITIGAGGPNWTTGSNSSITGFPVINPTGGGKGGGDGGADYPNAGGIGPSSGGNGGSGGGASAGYTSLTGGTGIAGEGFAGEDGGGGAGAIGGISAGSVDGPGGAGRQLGISGTSQFYGGGGGAGGAVGGAGGVGGGGAGSNGSTLAAVAGQAGTGGGGGGGSPVNFKIGAAGGSGVAIISYPSTLGSATGGTITSATGPGLVIRYPAPPSNSPDPNFKNTTLLLSSDETTTFIEDISPFNRNISIVGNSRPDSFNPYAENYSLNFNGSTNFQTVASTSTAAFGSEDFTVEAWIYVTGTTGTYRTIYSTRPTSNTAGVYTGGAFGVNPTGGLYWQTGELIVNNASDLLLTNSWNHVAVTKHEGYVNIFLNGSVVPNTDAVGVNALIVDYLVVAGGGGGGSTGGDGFAGQGGGGAGGLLTSSINANFGVTYPVIVGAGAAVGAVNGSTSSFISIEATGGGRGGAFKQAGFAGGSGGGGGGRLSFVGGVGTAGQGNSGGRANTGDTAGTGSGGGGGGAGAAGTNGVTGTGGKGGNGLASSISGTATYYAGGGGGMAVGTGGAGGLGGGGAGASAAGSTDLGPGGNATANTGGGGGGGPGVGPGLGGSGIIILRHPNTQPQATVTGGVTITTTGSNIVYTFTASGSITFVEPTPSYYPIDYLAVAGGGAGGASAGSGSNAGGGGGGAGGVISTSTTLAGGFTYVISVGAGGTGVTANLGNNGSDTVITGANLTTVTAIGGGGGGGGTPDINNDGSSGGSGGGGSGDSTFSTPLTGNGLGTAGQGNDGGRGGNGTSGNQAGGGGGGAGAAGSASVSNAAGNGGAGILSSISGAATYYAGGGGGAQSTVGGSTAGTGGLGGGGNGSNVGIDGNPGTNNTGGGGGGAGRAPNPGRTGGSGGSGVVIIRHSSTLTQATVTGNPIIANTGGNIVYTFTASGTILFAGIPPPVIDELTLTTATIGANFDGSEPFSGYISNLRAVKGQGLYTEEFSVGTQPLTTATIGHSSINSNITGTVALLTAASNRFVDKSPANLAITGTAKVSNLQPFNYPSNFNGSGYFNGTSDYLTVTADTAFTMGTGDFTVEAWVYLTTTATNGVSTTDRWIFGGFNFTPSFVCFINNSTIYRASIWDGTNQFNSSITIQPFTWTHVAWVRQAGTLNIYTNGVSGYINASYTTDWTASTAPHIGRADSSVDRYFPGYISNLRVVKGSAVYTSNFEPDTTPLTAFLRPELLTLQTNVPANNRAFRDASDSKAIITPVGSVTQGTANPYSGGWSGYFDGTGDYLTAPATDILNFGTGDFTIELWLYSTNVTSTAILLSNDGPTRTIGNVTFFISSGGNGFGIQRITTTGGTAETITYSSAGSVLANTWNHFAATKVGTTIRLFLNGVLVTTATSESLSWGTQIDPVQIGRRAITGFESYVTGYISNLRVVKGTAVYTSNFTPPVSDLPRIANTSLLTLQSSRFVDNSENNFTITRFGNASIERFSPHRTPGYNSVTNSGSMYFNGSTDYLEIPHNVNQLIGTDDFTIEAWVYLTSYGVGNPILAKGSATTGAQRFLFNTRITSGILCFEIDDIRVVEGGVVPLNSWNHVAVTRSAGIIYLWLNGVLTATTANATNFTLTTEMRVGRANGNTNVYFAGYISNLRLVVGTALYTGAGNFTIPQTPAKAVPNTVLLLNGTNGAVVDRTGRNDVITVGTAKLQKPFYYDNQSVLFSGNYLNIPYNALHDLSNGNFTIEAWVFPTTTGVTRGIINNWQTGGQFIYELTTSNTLQFSYTNVASGGSSITYVGTTTIPANTWTHVAVVRNNTSLTHYINGVIDAGGSYNIGTQTLFYYNGVGKDIRIGISNDISYPFTGTISDVRIVKGTAVYTANFTRPTTRLTAITNTLLLTCRGDSIRDYSVNNFAVNTVNPTGSELTPITQFGLSSVIKTSPYATSTVPNSMYFGTKTDYLAIKATTNLITFPVDFTFECWVRPTDATIISTWGIWDSRQSGSTANPMIFGLAQLSSPVSGSWRMYYYNGTSHYGTGIVQLGQWSHVAFVRAGSTMTFYVNGVAGGTATVSGTQTGTATTNPIWIGSKDNGIAGYGTVGYIDNFRITNGVARYTANFTAPLAPYPTR